MKLNNTLHVRKQGIPDIENESQEMGREDLKYQFIGMRARGIPYARIAQNLGVSKSTLSNWNSELEKEIALHKSMELEALQEEFFLLKEGRIRLLGEVLTKVREEALNRDLADVNTDKLFDIMLKYFNELKEEYIEPRPLSKRDLVRLENGTKLSIQDMETEVSFILDRYRSGILNIDQAKEEIYLLLSVLKAKEHEVLDDKINTLEAVLGGRR
jgi:DNA-binding transcriptional ArsR family regulator